MSLHNIQFHDKIKKSPLILFFLSYRKNFVGTQKFELDSKKAIGVRAIEIRLYKEWYHGVRLILKNCHEGRS